MNNFQKTICFFSFLICSSLTALNITSRTFDDVNQGWNSDELAKMYFHHSETQRQWAWEALSKISFSGDEMILDFGCRDGKISAEMSKLVKNGGVLGVDLSKNMIRLAKTYFPDFAFPNLAFKNCESITLSDFPGSQAYDVVCAFAIFHLISSPLEALENLKTHLKPYGKLLIVVPTGKNEALYQAANELFPKYGLEAPWNKTDRPKGSSMRTLDGCASLLDEAGYDVESLEVISTDNAFCDLDDLIAWMMGTAAATWQIPLSISEAFFSDLVHRMYELDPMMIDEEGRCRFKMPRMIAVASPQL